jgi:hypothetical protein
MGNFNNDWECIECGETQSKHNQFYDGKCESCNFKMKDDVESILISFWCSTIGQEPDNFEDVVQEVYETLLSKDKTIAEYDDVIEAYSDYSLRTKKKGVEFFLERIFNRICIEKPDNFDEILNFVFDDVNETADAIDWHDGDVAIAFRIWIENQTKG